MEKVFPSFCCMEGRIPNIFRHSLYAMVTRLDDVGCAHIVGGYWVIWREVCVGMQLRVDTQLRVGMQLLVPLPGPVWLVWLFLRVRYAQPSSAWLPRPLRYPIPWGVVFPSTSIASSYCTAALPALKTIQYEASGSGKHCKSREIHSSRGCELTETATRRFFSSEIWLCTKDLTLLLMVTVCNGHL